MLVSNIVTVLNPEAYAVTYEEVVFLLVAITVSKDVVVLYAVVLLVATALSVVLLVSKSVS